MKLKRLFRLAWLNIKATKQRSALAVIGIVIGIASVIAMVSLGMMARAEAARQFQLLGTDTLFLWAEKQSRRLEGFGLADVRALRQRSELIDQAAPLIENELPVRFGSNSESRLVYGVFPEELSVNHLRVAQGRFLRHLDNRMQFCVLGATLEEALAKAGAPIQVGDWLKIEGRPFQTIGVLEHKDVGTYGDPRKNEAVYIPIEMAMRIIGDKEVQRVTLKLRQGIPPIAAAKLLTHSLQEWKGDSVTFDIESPEQLMRQMEEQLGLFTLLLGFIAAISLIVGGVGIMNIMVVSVAERRMEIGLRRALGARAWDVQAQFLVECVLLTLVGGGGGIALGIATAWIGATALGWQPTIPLGAVALGVAVAVSLGIFFGWYPSRKAAALQPIEALR